MKKFGILLLSASLLLTACAANSASKNDQTATSSSAVVANQKELDKATAEYKTFVEDQIDQLLTRTETFAQLVKEGKLDEAKALYPLVRMYYERSEPIAESFGESDIKIDYRLVDYVEENGNEDGWTGYHRIERILWEQNTTQGAEVYADQLVKDIKELKAKIATVDANPELMLTGAVDLLNEVATTKITGEEEVYSHTDLYDFKANIEGAEKIFELFKPLLKEKDADLVKNLETEFKNVNDLLDKYKIDDENYQLYTVLTPADTKALAEAVTKLGEPLSQMGIILEQEK